jgi:hypothetical protein
MTPPVPTANRGQEASAPASAFDLGCVNQSDNMRGYYPSGWA